MTNIKVRYAPSPTGIPHIGNVRTALFNFLFARSQNGQFILRIEDTDRKRLIPSSIHKIKESLKIINLTWDGAEIYQSKRLPLYKKHLEILKDKNLSYQQEGAWYFKVPEGKKIGWRDLLHGSVEFDTSVIEDFVIVKSDDYPTYHFASVVDDHDMKISHVIRGDEWISSTPKHLLLYKALNWQNPEFVHLPPILGSGKKKLSKREGAKSVLEYIDEGFLPEALVNFLALLGWSPKGDREMFVLDELIKEFSLERLNKNSPIFNVDKLNWFNKKYLAQISTSDLVKKLKSYSKLAKATEDAKLTKILKLVQDRMTTLADFDKVAAIFFEKGSENPPEKEKVKTAKFAIESVKTWDVHSIAKNLDNWINVNKLNPADFKNTLRLAVFADNTPPIYESLAILTKNEVISRLNDALR